MQGRPIVYRANVDVHFGDLDHYGHVNSKHYLDYVLTSRWRFGEERFGETPGTWAEKGIGFYLSSFSVNYKRAIHGIQTLTIESFAEDLSKTSVNVSFAIWDQAKQTLYADGKLKFVVIDLARNRPTRIPEWGLPYLLED